MASATPSSSSGLSISTCGIVFEHISQEEADFLYEEIFERNCYLQRRIQVNDGDFVVDIGANIGLFSLYLISKFERLNIIAIEPIPKVFEVLSRNLKSCSSSTVRLLNYAVGESDCVDEFKYFHSLPGESTRHVDEQFERSKVLGVDSSGAVDTVFCDVRTLKTIIERDLGSADIMRTHGRIDLLKIDAEGDELNILTGMGSDLLAHVRQIVVEVYDINDRLLSVAEFLRKNSYDIDIISQRTALSEDGLYLSIVPADLKLFLVYAVQRREDVSPISSNSF